MMAGCTDKNFEKMLYAYELGMLSDKDRVALEMHLMECDTCFENVQKFNKSARLIRTDAVVRETIHELARADADDVQSESIRKGWPGWLKSTIAAAAVLIILILQPWKIEISPEQEAFAAGNLLAIMNFRNLENSDDPQKIGEIISNLLITDLSESQQFQVVSNERMFDMMKAIGPERIADENRSLSLQVAEQSNCTWAIFGTVLQTEPDLIVTSQIVEVTSGKIIGTEKITASPDLDIFSLADSLSRLIKNDLPLEFKTSEEPDRLVANITTHSLDAYRCYIEGIDYYNKRYYLEAVERFEKALEYDPTMAMAYYYLSELKDSKYIERAAEYSNDVTQLERLYIESRLAVRSGEIDSAIEILRQLVKRYPDEKRAQYLIGTYTYALGRYDEAADYLNNSIKLDPLFAEGYNLLGYVYAKMGEFDTALAMNDKFIFLSPNEPNPYDSRGDICVMHRQYNLAIESYNKALQKKDDFYTSWQNLGIVYTYLSEFVKAERCFQIVAKVEDIYIWSTGKVLLGHNLIYQGKLTEALAMLEAGSREDKKAHGQERYATYHHLPALIYEELGDCERALEELGRADTIIAHSSYSDKYYWHRFKAELLANCGKMSAAVKTAEELKAYLEKSNKSLSDYRYALGSIASAKGDYDTAIDNFGKAVESNPHFDYASSYRLGLALYLGGRYDQSIARLEETKAAQDSLPVTWQSWDARLYYFLGKSYEATGNLSKAAENYKIYLNIRKDADPDIETVVDTRSRLANLNS